ncbi:Zinc finger BED domain-containing protein 5 [Araneus ventricosus]|uniref:Zinc finger BED domain-containing protein 5 n=1 Tax=Araneus ventricosus TaxID=182803 RepID=A0A4Y2W6S3_ARAVE|nr:Zinc finger BED domain-containing protein 5 [Araneus ventricosus]
MLLCQPLPKKSTGEEILKCIDNFLKEKLNRLVKVCRFDDGARAMLGIHTRLVAIVKSVALSVQWTPCNIHIEALALKGLDEYLKNTLDEEVKIANFIKARLMNSRLFGVLCHEMGSEHKFYFTVKVPWLSRVTSVVTKVLAAVITLDRFGISDRAGVAIVSAALQDVGITSESNVLNVIDRNKIRRGRTKARTTVLSQVIKDYDHDQFGLYFDGRKVRTLSMEVNRRKVITEEHISLVKEPGSEYIGHVSVNFGRAQIIGNNISSFFFMR